MPSISKTKVITIGVIALILISAFFIITITNSYLMQTHITETSYAGLCDASLIAEPEKHEWGEYIDSAHIYAEAQKNESALFCFLIGKMYVTHKLSSGAGVDERDVLNSIIADEGGFYRLFSENPKRGIEIADAALAWNNDFGKVLTPTDTILLRKINEQILTDITALKNEYKMVLAQNSGITYTLEDLKNEGVILPSDESEFIEASDYSLEGRGKNVYYKTDLNLDGVDDIAFFTINSSKKTLTAVLNLKKDTTWIPYTLSLIQPSFDNSSFLTPSFYIEGNQLIFRYALNMNGLYAGYNIGDHFTRNWSEASGTLAEGKPTSAQIYLYTEFKDEVPVITNIRTSLGRYTGKDGAIHYDQQFDLKNSRYERHWFGFEGTASFESDIEKQISKPINFKPIPWSEFSEKVLAEILKLAV